MTVWKTHLQSSAMTVYEGRSNFAVFCWFSFGIVVSVGYGPCNRRCFWTLVSSFVRAAILMTAAFFDPRVFILSSQKCQPSHGRHPGGHDPLYIRRDRSLREDVWRGRSGRRVASGTRARWRSRTHVVTQLRVLVRDPDKEVRRDLERGPRGDKVEKTPY